MEKTEDVMITVNFSPEVDAKRTLEVINGIREDKMGGWVDLPRQVDIGELERIKAAAQRIQEESEYLVCIGVGGSYLGHRAVIEMLGERSGVKIMYAGNSFSRRELMRGLAEVGDADFSINVISKSGTTLEPAMAYEVWRRKLVEKYGLEEAARRIYVTTDGARGKLHDEAEAAGYARFVIPEGVGGRYSVLTPVGLLPMATAGVEIEKVLAGAAELAVKFSMENLGLNGGLIHENPAVKYAWMRYLLGEKGYDTEVFASFEPATLYFNEWLKQLFGESEGKGRKGLLPTSVIYSTDLHSLGQYIQDGRRNLFETIVNYPTDQINEKVVRAVQIAHAQGGIPVLRIDVSSYDEMGVGEMIYFFEMSCAISAKLIGVNPFDQPGVEAYKAELKRLLG